MDLLLRGGQVFRSGSFAAEDIAVSDGVVVGVDSFPRDGSSSVIIDCSGKVIVPGACAFQRARFFI